MNKISIRQTLQTRFAVIIFAILIPLIGVFLYASTTQLLLFWDDVPHMFWLASQPNGGYWLTSDGFPFYRPATFTVWEIFEGIWEYHNPQALHLLSISLHVLNAMLVAALGTKLSGQTRAGLWAGLIFVAFPFSYQTVIPTAAHFHLWLVFGILMAVWLILRWLDCPEKRWRLVAAWGCAFWAIFSHENGVLAPILIGGIVLAYQLTTLRMEWVEFRRRLIVGIGPILFLAGIYGLMWATVPKANEATGLDLTALDVKIGQTMQAIGFPLAALFEKLNFQDGNIFLTWLSGLIIVGIILIWTGWSWKNCEGKRLENLHVLAGMSLIWIPLVMLPAWAILDVNYLLGSPRLHYLASVGIAWLWGSWLARPFPFRVETPDRIQWQWIGGLSGVGICLLVAISFIRGRVAQHQRIDDIYREVGNISELMERDGRLLLVNGPAYLAPQDSIFLLGAEGSTYLPDFIGLGDWLVLNRYQDSGFTGDNRRADDIVPSTEEKFTVTHPILDRAMIREYDRVMVVMKVDGTPTALLSGEKALPEAEIEPLGVYEYGVMLREGTLGIFQAENPMILRATLEWDVRNFEDIPTEIFVHLVCNGQLVTQADGPPLGRLYPFGMWDSDEIWRDYRYLVLDQDYPLECLEVLVGLYNPNTNTRQIVTTADGTESDSVVIGYSSP